MEMHYVSCQMYNRRLVTIQPIQDEQPTPPHPHQPPFYNGPFENAWVSACIRY